LLRDTYKFTTALTYFEPEFFNLGVIHRSRHHDSERKIPVIVDVKV